MRDEDFVAEHSSGRPFYTAISYMLVSMECLIGAAYTRRVEAAGLSGHPRPSLGRIDADFADWRIGICSQLAQLWIDRNFALDYTLKSIEKILEGEARHQVRHTRSLLKDAAFALLGAMLEHIAQKRTLFRRSHAQKCLHTSCDPFRGDERTVQKMLGHAKPSMTLDVYGLLWPDRLDEVADGRRHGRAPHGGADERRR
ncbi:hypothetical protein [Salinactinospora qingdaonensis]|uniref:Phage integrase family protein n=1 Tax=Salinactinospora qingdaonensis TaxID=702744 RepID=A0ABP7G4B0_9ACTN